MLSSISHHFLLLLASSLHFKQATSLPLPAVNNNIPHPHIPRSCYHCPTSSSSSSSNSGINQQTVIIVGIIVGIIIFSILTYNTYKCCTHYRAFKKEEAVHSPRCNEEYMEACVASSRVHRVAGQGRPNRVCSCQGIVEGEDRNAMPRTGGVAQYQGELREATSVALAMNERLDARLVNEWNGQGRTIVCERETMNAGGIEAAPPPYSPADERVEGLRGPEPARIRHVRVMVGPNGNTIVSREGENSAAPETRQDGVWGRWAA